MPGLGQLFSQRRHYLSRRWTATLPTAATAAQRAHVVCLMTVIPPRLAKAEEASRSGHCDVGTKCRRSRRTQADRDKPPVWLLPFAADAADQARQKQPSSRPLRQLTMPAVAIAQLQLRGSYCCVARCVRCMRRVFPSFRLSVFPSFCRHGTEQGGAKSRRLIHFHRHVLHTRGSIR